MPIRTLVFLIGCLAVSPAVAQTCEEQAVGKVGGWIAGTDAGGSGSPATAANKARVNTVLDQIAAVVKRAYPEPTGSQGKLYRNYSLEPFAGGDLATYELVANFKGYGCDKRTDPNGQITMYGETATWLYVQVNSFWGGNSRFEYPQNFLGGEGQNLYSLQPARVVRAPQPGYPGRKPLAATLTARVDGHPSFIHEGEYDSTDYSYNRREVSQIVFLTPDGRPPYDPVTIGEFLDVNAVRLEAYVRENEQYGDVDYYRGLLERVAALRQRYGGRLSETAYIKSFSWSESELAQPDPFVGPDQGYMLARRSARYAGGGDMASPRFITVFWRWQPEAPYSVRMHEALRSNLDFAALKALLAS